MALALKRSLDLVNLYTSKKMFSLLTHTSQTAVLSLDNFCHTRVYHHSRHTHKCTVTQERLEEGKVGDWNCLMLNDEKDPEGRGGRLL